MQTQRRPLAPQETDHELVWLLVSLGGFIAGALWFAARLPLPHCVFHELTGWPCLTCGATRAAVQFLQGHFAASFLYNPLAFLAYGGLTLFDVYALGVLLTRGRRFRLGNFSRAEKHWIRWGVALVLGVNWVYLLAAHRV